MPKMNVVVSDPAKAIPCRRSKRSPLRKLGLGLLIASCGLVGLEFAARLTIPAGQATRFQQINQIVVFLGTQESDLMLDYDPDRFWKLKPGISIDDPNNRFWLGTVSNSRGFRSPEFSLEKPAGTTRIVCFGDSSTFGIGATMEDTWPSQLQELLQQDDAFGDLTSDRRFEVINAGVPGYTSYQGLQYMRQEIDRLQPDIVMASYANNDFWHWDQTTDAQHAEELRRKNGVRSVLMSSRLAQGMDSLLQQSKAAKSDAVPARQTASPNQHWAAAATDNYIQPIDEWTRRVPLDDFRNNIHQMTDLCKQRRLPLVLVKWPDQPQAAGQWSPRIAYQDVLEEVAAERGLLIADVVRLFQENKSWSIHTYVPNDIVHVNRAGNSLAAIAARDAILESLNPQTALTN